MTHRQRLSALVLVVALTMTAGVGAALYNLPDVAAAPGTTATTNLVISDGTDQAAININIDFNTAIVTPVTAGITVGGGAPGFMVQSNIEPANRLRIVIYKNPTGTFEAGRQVLVSIPWTVNGGAAQGDFSDLTITTLGVSSQTGVSISDQASAVGGRIVVANPITEIDVAAPAEDLTNWTSFQGLPFPANAGTPPPYMTVSPNGSANLSVTTSADDTLDGYAGWGSGNTRAPWVADSVYLIRWGFSGQVTEGNLNQVRVRAQEDVFNSMAELTITPTVPGAPFSSVGEITQGTDLGGGVFGRTYELFYETSNLSAGLADDQEIQFTFDVVDFSDNLAGTVTLTNFEVSRLNKADVDAVFQQRFPAPSTSVDFTNTTQWVQGLSLGTFPPDPVTGFFPMAPVTYAPSAAFLDVATGLPDPDGAGPQIGYFQEFGMQPDLLNNQDGVIWRERVDAESLNAADRDNGPTIRMRLTDETQAFSAQYIVRAVAGRIGPAVGSNRPPVGSTLTYSNYLAYPAGANIQNLLASNFNSMIGVLSLLDFEENAGGNIRFSNFRIEAAPRNALLP